MCNVDCSIVRRGAHVIMRWVDFFLHHILSLTRLKFLEYEISPPSHLPLDMDTHDFYILRKVTGTQQLFFLNIFYLEFFFFQFEGLLVILQATLNNIYNIRPGATSFHL
jgi:hypothetical protein